MSTRIINPSFAPPGWVDERAANFEMVYPDFYQNPDIVLALEKAHKAKTNVP